MAWTLRRSFDAASSDRQRQFPIVPDRAAGWLTPRLASGQLGRSPAREADGRGFRITLGQYSSCTGNILPMGSKFCLYETLLRSHPGLVSFGPRKAQGHREARVPRFGNCLSFSFFVRSPRSGRL